MKNKHLPHSRNPEMKLIPVLSVTLLWSLVHTKVHVYWVVHVLEIPEISERSV